MQMIGISIHFTIAASWLICNGCVSNVSLEWRAIFYSKRIWNRICHLPFSALPLPDAKCNENQGGVYVCKIVIEKVEMLMYLYRLLPGFGAVDRKGMTGPRRPKRDAD